MTGTKRATSSSLQHRTISGTSSSVQGRSATWPSSRGGSGTLKGGTTGVIRQAYAALVRGDLARKLEQLERLGPGVCDRPQQHRQPWQRPRGGGQLGVVAALQGRLCGQRPIE